MKTKLHKPMKIILPGGVQEQWLMKAMSITFTDKQKVLVNSPIRRLFCLWV